jgi:protocatechuate 3,4-dioxygenase beta subunit
VDDLLTRRRLLALGLALPFGTRLLDLLDADAGAAVLAPTAACDDHPTEAQTEGPYFTPSSPLRRSLRTAGVTGTALSLTGRVLTTRCKPVAHALLDFWQADARGAYDNSGYRLRGHQFTDSRGRFRLETIVPGLYPGRTRHIHVKVQAPRKPVLTTQLYFPGEPQNAGDGIFDASLLLRGWKKVGARRVGVFDFVLDV